MSLYIAAELRRRVRKHFADCCAYCRTAEWLTVVTFEIEHIVPISAGGSTEFDNLCFAYPMCNRHKADRTAGLDPTTGCGKIHWRYLRGVGKLTIFTVP